MAGGLVDALCPMAYTPDAGLFRQQVAQVRARVGPGRTVWAGVGAYRLSAPAVVDRILIAREAGASGVVLFSHESLDPEALARLRTDAFVPAAAGGAWKDPPGARPGDLLSAYLRPSRRRFSRLAPDRVGDADGALRAGVRGTPVPAHAFAALAAPRRPTAGRARP
jgi:hypothetical protein